MEDSSSFNRDLRTTLSHLKFKSENLDQVSAHCRQDHLTPHNLEERMNRSCYRSAFSPPKLLPDYNQSVPERELQ